jgi:hypothetical protein
MNVSRVYVSQEAFCDTLRQYWLTGKTLRGLDTTAFPLKTAVPGGTKRRLPNGHSRSQCRQSTHRPFGETSRQEGAT